MNKMGSIRDGIKKFVGEDIELILINRRKHSLRHGRLEGAYNSLFTVAIEIEGTTQHYSYTYCDILTKKVFIRPMRLAAE